MKKILISIIISIILVLILITGTFIITYKLIHYSLSDADRVCDIVLERTKPTPLDYLRLDMNHDKEITMLDALLIAKKVYGE